MFELGSGVGTGRWQGRRWRKVGFWTAILTVCALSGAFYGQISRYGRPAAGAVFGFGAGGGVMLFQQGLVLHRLQETVRRLPWLVGVLATELVYLAIILASSVLVGGALWFAGVLDGTLVEAVSLSPVTALYAMVVTATLITMTRMRDLIGTEAFRNVLLGRYYHPVEEERIFLFIDLIGSTDYAQTHGDLRAQAFLGAIFAALADPVRHCGGSIDDYVGDMALVTWPMRRGLARAQCLICFFAFSDAIEAQASAWRREFGQVPRFRAALHGGSVVTAEVGIDRHKIAYFGDVVNTTGRIEALCRSLDAPFLVSADLLERFRALPEAITVRPLGTHALKGRGQRLGVLAVERTAAILAGAVA